MNITPEQIEKLNKKLPDWAVKPHPTKTNMSAIHPMSIIDRLNEVFGVGGWNYKTEYIACNPFVQKTKNGERGMFMSAVKGIVEIGDLVIEQYGGSSNDDMGDALKGGATDALTKIASYLGIGAEIYKGHGNTEKPAQLTDDERESSEIKLESATTKQELKEVWLTLSDTAKADDKLKDFTKTLSTKLK